ncbi:MAG TPA: hypothetical protein DDZ88_01780 [Verrucomicrobiales bacterium]|nr:hypothetical protein [Verrucomicrobiales bacterium]
MRSILTPIFCIIVTLIHVGSILAQGPPVLTDEMMRRLGGDPDKSRADAAERALQTRTPEEVANDNRAMEMSDTLTDEIITNIPSSDPLLLALYTNRIGTGSGVSNESPWLLVVDRDIRRRPEAKTLFQTIFRTTNRHGRRFYVMNWLAGNADVPWGNDIMEEAIKLYQTDPSTWEYADVGVLCRLIQVRGNESHLVFLDEVNAGIGDNGAGRSLRRRLEQAGKARTAQAEAPTAGARSTPPLQTNQPARPQAENVRIYWLAGGVLVTLVGFLLWRRMRQPCRKGSGVDS